MLEGVFDWVPDMVCVTVPDLEILGVRLGVPETDRMYDGVGVTVPEPVLLGVPVPVTVAVRLGVLLAEAVLEGVMVLEAVSAAEEEAVELVEGV